MAAARAATGRWTRDYLFDILRDLGIKQIFGVPGTNEIPIIDGTDIASNGVTYVECLHENIAIGAAMGSARMTGLPGILLVHITPGIGHSIGNLFNAYKSQVPLIVLCAQQQNELVTQEPILASNLVDLAKQYTKWAHEVRAPEEIPLVLQRAFKEAMAPPNGPVFISFPWEFMIRQIGKKDRVQGVTRISPHFTGDADSIREAAKALSGARNPIIVAGDAVGYANAWPELGELAQLIGAPVLLETFSSLANFPNDDVHWQGELPGSQAAVQQTFAGHDVAFLCGFGSQAQLPVFKYSDGPLIPPGVKQVYLTNDTWQIGKNFYGEVAVFGDVKATLPEINRLVAENPPAGAAERNRELEDLAEQRADQWAEYIEQATNQEKEIWGVVVANAVRAAIEKKKLARQFVYVHEAVSDPAPFQFLLPFNDRYATPISYYCVAGGSLGWSMPAALGIKLEIRGHQGIGTKLVVNAVGDGSSLFYAQSWWTAAHRRLPILTIIMNNREYHTLQLGLQQVIGAYGKAPGYMWQPQTTNPSYLRIERPEVDFLSLARSFGVTAGARVTKPKDVMRAVEDAVDHVLKRRTAYVLEIREEQSPPAPPPTAEAPPAVPKRFALQPPLNMLTRNLAEAVGARVPMSVPVIF